MESESLICLMSITIQLLYYTKTAKLRGKKLYSCLAWSNCTVARTCALHAADHTSYSILNFSRVIPKNCWKGHKNKKKNKKKKRN